MVCKLVEIPQKSHLSQQFNYTSLNNWLFFQFGGSENPAFAGFKCINSFANNATVAFMMIML